MSSMAEDLIRRHRYTVEDYYRMAEVGILTPDVRVELIDGEVIEMPPIRAPHASVVNRLHTLLVEAVQGHALVRGQSPLRLDRHNEPEPDLALVRTRPSHYGSRHPGPKDTLLVIEVADSSLSYDRDRKLSLYARFDIPEVWLIDLSARTIRRYRIPGPTGYVESDLLADLLAVAVPGIPSVHLNLSRLLL